LFVYIQRALNVCDEISYKEKRSGCLERRRGVVKNKSNWKKGKRQITEKRWGK